MRPRYVVRSLTGFGIDIYSSGRSATSRKPPTSYYVLDSCYGYEVVRAFESPLHGRRGITGPMKIGEASLGERWRKRAARELAQRLNTWDREETAA